MWRSPAPVSSSHSVACSSPPRMSVYGAASRPSKKSVMVRRNARFWSLALDGWPSKVTPSTMSSAVKLALSMRATARESPVSSVPNR